MLPKLPVKRRVSLREFHRNIPLDEAHERGQLGPAFLVETIISLLTSAMASRIPEKLPKARCHATRASRIKLEKLEVYNLKSAFDESADGSPR